MSSNPKPLKTPSFWAKQPKTASTKKVKTASAGKKPPSYHATQAALARAQARSERLAQREARALALALKAPPPRPPSFWSTQPKPEKPRRESEAYRKLEQYIMESSPPPKPPQPHQGAEAPPSPPRTTLQVAAPLRTPDVSLARFTPLKVYEAKPDPAHPDLYVVLDDNQTPRKILLNRPCPWLPNPDSNRPETNYFWWAILNDEDEVVDGYRVVDSMTKGSGPLPVEAQILISRKDELSPQETMRLLEFKEATQGIDTAPVHRSLRDQAQDLPVSKTLLAYEYARGALSHVSRDTLHTLLADAPRRQD